MQPVSSRGVVPEVLRAGVDDAGHILPRMKFDAATLRKPENQTVLLAGEGEDCRLSADRVRYNYAVPERRVFEYPSAISGRRPAKENPRRVTYGHSLLEDLYEQSTLHIVSHGEHEGLRNNGLDNRRKEGIEAIQSPDEIAQMLKNEGLKKVGVIRLHACLVGSERGRFLEKLAAALAKRNIDVGYITGVKTIYRVDQNWHYEATDRPNLTVLNYLWLPKSLMHQNICEGTRVLRCKLPIDFVGTPFTAANKSGKMVLPDGRVVRTLRKEFGDDSKIYEALDA